MGFHYLDGSIVTLWYRGTGCQTVSNGHVDASQIANPSFDTFQTVLASVAPSLPG